MFQTYTAQNIKKLNNLGKYLCISEILNFCFLYFVMYNACHPPLWVIYSLCNLYIYNIDVDVGAFKICFYILFHKLYCF